MTSLNHAGIIKKRGSKQWRKLNSKIRNIYTRIDGQTKHYLHMMANQILADHPDVIGFYLGDWDKSQTLADTGYKFIDKRINRQVQNNNPIMTLVGYLSYKAAMRCKEVREFNERGTTRTCPMCGFTIPRDINSTLSEYLPVCYMVQPESTSMPQYYPTLVESFIGQKTKGVLTNLCPELPGCS